MTWAIFYLCCFVLGLVLCVLTAATGGGHGAGHAPVHLHVHPHLRHGSAASPVNAFTVTAFLCWFGGVGYLLERHTGAVTWLALLGATGGGLVGAGILYVFLLRVLLPHERELTAEETAVAGVVGRVSGSLGHGRVGEVQYTQLDARRSVPARSATGTAIAPGAEVVVLRYEDGIAYVEPWHEMDTSP